MAAPRAENPMFFAETEAEPAFVAAGVVPEDVVDGVDGAPPLSLMHLV